MSRIVLIYTIKYWQKLPVVQVWYENGRAANFINPSKIFAESVNHVIKVNPNLRARIVPTVSQSESDLDAYALQYIDEVGSGYFEYRRIFGEWADHYGTILLDFATSNPII